MMMRPPVKPPEPREEDPKEDDETEQQPKRPITPAAARRRFHRMRHKTIGDVFHAVDRHAALGGLSLGGGLALGLELQRHPRARFPIRPDHSEFHLSAY